MDTRASMLATLDDEYRRTAARTGLSQPDPRVRDAMARVPRERFVPWQQASRAYWNGPLPIGQGQTISQPFIVALMTELIDPRPNAVVLEIGTGSGYQAAILSGLVKQIYSVEVVERLARDAAQRLAHLGYHNVEVKYGDGYCGWPEHAPYDAIIVTAVAPSIPAPLLEQLAPGGRMVIPLGAEAYDQHLTLVEKDSAGHTHLQSVLPVTFVPMTGERVS